MFSIFKRKRQQADLSWMQVDMHSHILPGLDDGCQDVDMSKHLLMRLQELGLSQFYFTPHIFQEMYPNTKETIALAFEQLHAQVGQENMDFAAEYMVDSAFAQLLQNPEVQLLTLPGKHVLIEMSYIEESKQIEKAVFDLLIAGYKPILAHPERYVYYHQRTDRIRYLREIGCLLQVNLLSVFGYYGSQEQRVARHLLEKGDVDLIGTDVHHERHVNALSHALQREDAYSYFKKCNIQNQNLFGK